MRLGFGLDMKKLERLKLADLVVGHSLKIWMALENGNVCILKFWYLSEEDGVTLLNNSAVVTINFIASFVGRYGTLQ